MSPDQSERIGAPQDYIRPRSSRYPTMGILAALAAAAPACGGLPQEEIAATTGDLEVAPAAGPGVKSKAVPFNDMNFYTLSGGVRVLRAQLRNGIGTWYKDTIDGDRWVVLTAEIRDHSTDGLCAKVRFLADNAVYGSECNAVWIPQKATIFNDIGSDGRVEVILYRAHAADNTAPAESPTYQALHPPAGYL